MTALPTSPSSMCRDGNHKNCARLQARCACDCHGRTPQMPPTTADLSRREHGVRATYVKGCRCEACTQAERDYKRDQRGGLKPMSPPRSIEEARARSRIEVSPLSTKSRDEIMAEKRAVQPPTVELVWEPPPALKSGPHKQKLVDEIGPLLEQVRTRPGEWARIVAWSKESSASSQRKKCVEAHPDFEFVARKTNDGSALWARYVPPEGDADDT